MDGRCQVNPLVVRRKAPSKRRMKSAAIVEDAQRPRQRLNCAVRLFASAPVTGYAAF